MANSGGRPGKRSKGDYPEAAPLWIIHRHEVVCFRFVPKQISWAKARGFMKTKPLSENSGYASNKFRQIYADQPRALLGVRDTSITQALAKIKLGGYSSGKTYYLSILLSEETLIILNFDYDNDYEFLTG